MTTQALAVRGAGLVLLLAFFLFFEPGNLTLLHRAVWPLIAILGASLVLRNRLVLALATVFFAALNSNPGGADPYTGFIYPTVAVAAALLLMVSILQRFLAHIQNTRTERWDGRVTEREIDENRS